jgi:hypothetical protein
VGVARNDGLSWYFLVGLSFSVVPHAGLAFVPTNTVALIPPDPTVILLNIASGANCYGANTDEV